MPSGVDFTPLYAAVIAIVALSVAMYRYATRRRARLIVSASVADLPGQPLTRIVDFRAHNYGRLTAPIQQCGLATVRGHRLRLRPGSSVAPATPAIDLGSPGLPATVAPGETFRCHIAVRSLAGRRLGAGERWSDYTHAYFVDGVGRHHLGKVHPELHDALNRESNR